MAPLNRPTIWVDLPAEVLTALDNQAKSHGQAVNDFVAAILMRRHERIAEHGRHVQEVDEAFVRNIQLDPGAVARVRWHSRETMARNDGQHYDYLVDEAGRFHRWSGHSYEPMSRSKATTIAYGVFS